MLRGGIIKYLFLKFNHIKTMLQSCPPAPALTPISAVNCAQIFDQIVMAFFQRTQSAAPFANEAALKTLSNWDTLIAAADSTKIIYTPAFSSANIAESEALTQGGNDNTTFNGIPEYYGEGFAPFVGVFKNLPSTQKVQLSALSAESIASATGVARLSVFLVNRHGQIIHNNLKGIPCYNFRISSTGTQGLNSANTNTIGFVLPPNWDDSITVSTPDFDPFTDL